ncbi:MAG TPA: NB-ARC domain-containing protein [Ktedonobacteraceae bacterium]|nr:NB-ARC domain-containing protein [Ktedonobacteraceae bacterium]
MAEKKTFSGLVLAYLRKSGHTQKELASAIGIHHQVLNRKFHKTEKSRFNQDEMKQILRTLASWRVITTREEALELLELAEMLPGSFSKDEWNTPPLKNLEQKLPALLAQPKSHPQPVKRHNLPAPKTRLIGRASELQRLRQLLQQEDIRLITLTGPGGSGKTRLAWEIGHEALSYFEDGVWLVELAGVNQGLLVPMSIIQALGITPRAGLNSLQNLIQSLQDRFLLLILDNFEHLTEATGTISELLSALPRLKVLITSRSVLRLYGEYEIPVLPLALPPAQDGIEPAQLLLYPTISLFVERARAADPNFELSHQNSNTIVEICRRIDGLPLAIELAAARVKFLSPMTLLERLSQQPLNMLTGGPRDHPQRMYGLRNTFEWSYSLLSPTEQRWFSRLGVFAGGWQLEAVEALLQDQDDFGDDAHAEAVDSLKLLQAFVDNSLLVKLYTDSGQIRFQMLETLRTYALEQLAARKELERLRKWHASYYLRLAEAAEVGLRGERQLEWLTTLVEERDNLRGALLWLLISARDPAAKESFYEVHEPVEGMVSSGLVDTSSATWATLAECAFRLAAALAPYWEWQGYISEGRRWLEEALLIPLPENAGTSLLAARGRVQSQLALLIHMQGDRTTAIEVAEASIATWKALNNPDGLAMALFNRGWLAHIVGDIELSTTYFDQSLQLLSETGNPWLRAQLYYYLGETAAFKGQIQQAREYLTQSQKLFQQVGDKRSIVDVQNALAGLYILEGEFQKAIQNLFRSVQHGKESAYKKAIAEAIGMIAFAIGLSGKPEPAQASRIAALMLGAAESLLESIGVTTWLLTEPTVKKLLEFIQSRLPGDEWETARASGRLYTPDQALELAYSQKSTPSI